jgi:hypothetical protein
MKWISLSLLAALAVFVSACEQHTAAETEAAFAAEEGKAAETAPDPASAATPETKSDSEKPPADWKPAKFIDSK